MTSSRAYSNRKFAVAAEIDGAAVRAINSALLRIGKEDAQKAMRRGFSKWGSATKRMLAAAAPMGRTASTERVRGAVRPNVHLKFNAATRAKGYRKGLVQWIAVGIKEIRGSYLTPHWYLRWVENGHNIVRRATAEEELRARTRGESPKLARRKTIGRVAPNPFVRRTATVALSQVDRFLMPEIEKAVKL